MSSNESIISLEGVSFNYNQHPVLQDINLSILPGQFIGIIGPNGSGKTTLLKLISGILSPKQGKIKIFNEDIDTISRKKIAKMISLVPQDSFISYNYKVKEVVFMGRIPFINQWRGETALDYQISREAMEKTDSLCYAEKGIHQISGGEAQRVYIARALAQSPKILMLDEFTSHLDLSYKYEIVKILQDSLKEKVQCIISVFHDLNLASYCSDQLILLNEGIIEEIGTPQEVINEYNLKKVYRAKNHIVQHPELAIPQVIM
ncbi:MAG TPA: ABC transporter ATP-binding protein [Atribacterota bacterium]|nr:ABC transporter ATP-binding protein [Atribacterota bacterium]HOR42392.1 ABC transporter ATP-binding protein [Atribacterota bacterium]HPK87701.1 ABC transporter ATP-binding protein [Atribacterota bacterium]